MLLEQDKYVITFSEVLYIFAHTNILRIKVRINCAVYDHMNTFIEDMIIGSHN